ncbi:MAG: outer membrane beta-barrel protein [Cyclobacteriaceae bacterium]|nr:outer membrane beta-barrel protein [Cyclobacteriaceae bacterium]
MQSISDDELDKLMKEAAQGFSPPDDPAAWKEMSNKLDERDKFIAWKKWGSITFIALLVISTSIVYYYTQERGEKINSSVSRIKSQKDISEARVKANPDKATTNKSHEVEVAIQGTFNQPEVSPTLSIPVKKNKVADYHFSGKDQSENHRIKPTAHTSKSGIAQVSERLTTLPETELATAQDLAEKETQTTSDNAANLSSPNSENKIVYAPDSASLPADSELIGNERRAADEDRIDNPKTDSHHYPFSIKLAFSPDFSSINFFTADKPGINIGLLAGYTFNQRWSVYTGAILSRKIYTSTEIDKPYSSGGYNYPITELNGDCRVIDIPVNIYYSFFTNRSFSLKAGLGLSSYLMLQEDYTYSVKKYYTTDTYYQRIDHQNNEWLEVMNISLLVQKKVSDRFYLEIEPFYKAPLAGIGEGKVSLVSLGTFLTLRFDIQPNKPN